MIRPRLAAEEDKQPEDAATNGVMTVQRLHDELVKLRPTEQEMVRDRWHKTDVRSIVKCLYYYNLYSRRFSKIRTTASVASVARKFKTTEYAIQRVCDDWFRL